MAATPTPKRILPFAVVGARTNNGAVLEYASAQQWIEGKQVACVGDKVFDPIDGEVTIVSGRDLIKDHGKAVAAPGSVLSNGSFIVDAGQSLVCWTEYDEHFAGESRSADIRVMGSSL